MTEQSQQHKRVGQLALTDRRSGQNSPSRSIEYVFSTITLLTTAFSLILVLIIWVNSLIDKTGASFDAMALPAAGLIIGLPVLAGLSFDLQAAETKNPGLKLDVYKNRCGQLIKTTAFTTCFFALIGLVFGIFIRAGSTGGDGSLPKLFADVFITVAVAGGILAFYIAADHPRA